MYFSVHPFIYGMTFNAMGSTYNTVSTPTFYFGEATVTYVRYVHCSSVRIQVCMKYCNCIQYTSFFQEPSDTTNLVQNLHIHTKDKRMSLDNDQVFR